jgi:hypothetical protein
MASGTRLWMYRAGEARLFDRPGDVPGGEGWQRFPVPAGGSETPAKAPRVSLPAPSPGQELTDEEKLNRMSRQRLMQVAADCGIRFDFGWTKVQLKHAIIEVLNDNGP